MEAKTSGPKGAYGNLSAAPGVGATLSEDASGVLRHKRDPLNALSSALAGLKAGRRSHAFLPGKITLHSTPFQASHHQRLDSQTVLTACIPSI